MQEIIAPRAGEGPTPSAASAIYAQGTIVADGLGFTLEGIANGEQARGWVVTRIRDPSRGAAGDP